MNRYYSDESPYDHVEVDGTHLMMLIASCTPCPCGVVGGIGGAGVCVAVVVVAG